MDMLTFADLTLKELEKDKVTDTFTKKQVQVIMYNLIDSELDKMLGSLERNEV